MKRMKNKKNNYKKKKNNNKYMEFWDDLCMIGIDNEVLCFLTGSDYVHAKEVSTKFIRKDFFTRFKLVTFPFDPTNDALMTCFGSRTEASYREIDLSWNDIVSDELVSLILNTFRGTLKILDLTMCRRLTILPQLDFEHTLKITEKYELMITHTKKDKDVSASASDSGSVIIVKLQGNIGLFRPEHHAKLDECAILSLLWTSLVYFPQTYGLRHGMQFWNNSIEALTELSHESFFYSIGLDTFNKMNVIHKDNSSSFVSVCSFIHKNLLVDFYFVRVPGFNDTSVLKLDEVHVYEVIVVFD